MKLLNLVIYSRSVGEDGYERMQEILSKYYKTFEPRVNTLFVILTEELPYECVLKDNILHIKGTESYIPGILEKTIKAFELCRMLEFDYLIRSNISSIINFDLLIKELEKNPVSFYGGVTRSLQWEGGGITDSTWFGTIFAYGTSMIFTKEAVWFILEHKHLIRYDIIDDVAIGILMREYKPDIQPQQILQSSPHYSYMTTPCFFTYNGAGAPYTFDKQGLIQYVKDNDIVIYRNKCSNCRKVDEIQMEVIVDVLMQNNI